MPEGPEIRTVVDELAPQWMGKYLLNVWIDERLAKKMCISTVNQILPQKIVHVYSHGKRIIIRCEFGLTLISHLLMSGRWELQSNKYSQVCLGLGEPQDDVLTPVVNWYNNNHRFGLLDVCHTETEFNAWVCAKLGVDVMSVALGEIPMEPAEWTARWRQFIGRHKTWQICKALLEQTFLSGIGNYVKAEVLYLSRIHPETLIASLTDDQLVVLLQAVKYVCYHSYKNNGATVESYISPSGRRGNYQQYLLVYGRKQCPGGHEIKTKKYKDGRTSHYCEVCQIKT